MRVIAQGVEHRLQAQIAMACESLDSCNSEEQLRGLEGSVQKGFFSYWRQQLDPAWGFEQRIRRLLPDLVKALFSFAYSPQIHYRIQGVQRAVLPSTDVLFLCIGDFGY